MGTQRARGQQQKKPSEMNKSTRHMIGEQDLTGGMREDWLNTGSVNAGPSDRADWQRGCRCERRQQTAEETDRDRQSGTGGEGDYIRGKLGKLI